MDFELDETQRVIAGAAADLLGRPAQSAGTGADPGYDVAAWLRLANAGLLALTLPGWLGGDDHGVVEAAILATEAGRRAATIPILPTIMLGVLPILRWGRRELAEQVLPGVASGEVIMTAAVREPSAVFPGRPATTITVNDGPATVTGTKVGVPYAAQASWILVPGSVSGGRPAVAVVSARAPGLTTHRTPVSGDGPEYTLRLAGAPVTGLLTVPQAVRNSAPAAGTGPVDDLYQLAAAGAAAAGDGAVAGALQLTKAHLAVREQFGRPLATFQAVAQQVADVYITGRTLHLAATSACWRLASGRPAAEEADIAAYWLAAQAPQALRTCHHLHGGTGLDISYPLHRYSALVSDLVRFTGGADYLLGRLAGQPAESGQFCEREGAACSSS